MLNQQPFLSIKKCYAYQKNVRKIKTAMKPTVAMITAAFVLSACSSTRHIAEKTEPQKEKDTTYTQINLPLSSPIATLLAAIEVRKSALSVLDITAAVNATINGTAAPPANCTMTICRDDSLAMTFRAFGISVGKLYARSDYFLFFDAFNNRALEGAPNAANIARAINVPLSYQDFARLLRGEPPGDIALFAPSADGGDMQSSSKSVLFQRKTPGNGIEYALFSIERQALVQYQRKAADGTIQINARYEDFIEADKIQVAKKVAITVPAQNSTVAFSASDITVNSSEKKRLSFSVPSSVPRSRLE